MAMAHVPSVATVPPAIVMAPRVAKDPKVAARRVVKVIIAHRAPASVIAATLVASAMVSARAPGRTIVMSDAQTIAATATVKAVAKVIAKHRAKVAATATAAPAARAMVKAMRPAMVVRPATAKPETARRAMAMAMRRSRGATGRAMASCPRHAPAAMELRAVAVMAPLAMRTVVTARPPVLLMPRSIVDVRVSVGAMARVAVAQPADRVRCACKNVSVEYVVASAYLAA